jgi:2-oxoglutarate dehydrogenase E2 component (dihydrolipoamide succinyltransferase)
VLAEEKIVKTPEMAESITEGTLKGWSVKEGDYVEVDQEIGSIETDKIDVAINSPAAGTIKKFLANEEDTVQVGQDLIVMELGGEPGQSAEKGGSETKEAADSKQETSSDKGGEQKQPEPESQEDAGAGRPKEKEQKEGAPSAPQQKAEEPKQPQPPKQQESKPSTPQQTSSKPKQDESSKVESPYGPREERRVKMNRMRLRIAERLKQSQNTAASLTTFNEVDMSNLMDMRKMYKDEILKKTGIKFGFMGAFAKASILAMKTVPTVNASIEGPGGGDTIVYRDYVDISVAVATEKGLVTPVVRNAEALDMVGIESSIADMGKKVSPPTPDQHSKTC